MDSNYRKGYEMEDVENVESPKSTEGSPLKFSLDYPESLSRGTLLLKSFLGWAYVGIPHGIILLLYAVAVNVVAFIAWWAILFTGSYPRGMFDFVVNYTRWTLRVNIYMSYLTDSYPPFNGDGDVEGSPLGFSVDYPERLSRGVLLLRAFLGWLYVGIPHGVILCLYGIAVCVVQFIAWWAILFTGKYPEGMFEFVVKFMRWALRVGIYTSYLTDVYPPFNGDE